MRTTTKLHGMVITFISSGMGTTDYRVQVVGFGENESTRLKINQNDKTAGRYIAPDKRDVITPANVKELYNTMLDAGRVDFEEWAAKQEGVNLDDYPRTPYLTEINVI